VLPGKYVLVCALWLACSVQGRVQALQTKWWLLKSYQVSAICELSPGTQIFREVGLHASLAHENVVQLTAAFQAEDHPHRSKEEISICMLKRMDGSSDGGRGDGCEL